jgi:hypothetical protein
MNRLTRRELAGALSASAVALAQTPSAPGDELKTTRDQMQAYADQLDKFPLPMSVEPATIFKP